MEAIYLEVCQCGTECAQLWTDRRRLPEQSPTTCTSLIFYHMRATRLTNGYRPATHTLSQKKRGVAATTVFMSHDWLRLLAVLERIYG